MLWLSLFFLLTLAGVIAYAGDVVGRRVGRKHYRLFGLRPRTTGLVYAIVSGVLISLVSVLAFAAFNQQALRNIVEADSLRLELRGLRDQVAPLRSEVAQVRGQLEQATTQRDAARREALRLEARQKIILRDKRTFEHEVADLQAVRTDLTIRSSQLEEQNRDLEGQASELEAQVERAEAQVQRSAQAVRQREQALEGLRAQARAAELRLKSSQQQLEQTAERLKSSQQQLEQARVRFQGTQTQLGASRSQLGAAARQLEVRAAQLEALGRQKVALEGRAQDLQTQRLQLEGQLASLERQLRALEVQRASLERERATLEADKQRLGQTLALERQQAVQVSAGLERLERRSSALSTQLERQGKEVATLKAARDRAQADLGPLLAQRRTLEADNLRLKDSLGALEAERGKLQADLGRLGGELEAQRTGEFVYRRNDLVFQSVLERVDTPTLDAALQKALRRVQQRGAKGSLSSVLSAEDKAGLLERLKGMGGKRALLILRSATNTLSGSPIRFQAELLSNEVIFPRAQPIRSRLIAVGSDPSQSELRAGVEALETSVLEALRQAGVPAENVLEGGLSESDTFELGTRLQALGGNVLVGLAARDDVRPSAQVELYPVILR